MSDKNYLNILEDENLKWRENETGTKWDYKRAWNSEWDTTKLGIKQIAGASKRWIAGASTRQTAVAGTRWDNSGDLVLER